MTSPRPRALVLFRCRHIPADPSLTGGNTSPRRSCRCVAGHRLHHDRAGDGINLGASVDGAKRQVFLEDARYNQRHWPGQICFRSCPLLEIPSGTPPMPRTWSPMNRTSGDPAGLMTPAGPMPALATRHALHQIPIPRAASVANSCHRNAGSERPVTSRWSARRIFLSKLPVNVSQGTLQCRPRIGSSNDIVEVERSNASALYRYRYLGPRSMSASCSTSPRFGRRRGARRRRLLPRQLARLGAR